MKKPTATILIVAALLAGMLIGDAVVEKAEAGACWGLKPMCGHRSYPVCICYDYTNTNCAWQCVYSR